MKVLQLIDSLNAGGAERVAVNYANSLAAHIETSYLCTTREEGALKESLSNEVQYLFLEKKSTFDFTAIRKLNSFIKNNRINIIHAHASSFFMATIIKVLNPKLGLIWHDHYGSSEFLNKRPKFALTLCSVFFNHVFSVNTNLSVWAKENLNVKSVSYLSNFAVLNESLPITTLKGIKGKRIICLANLRPDKDHLNLLKAFQEVYKSNSDWTLHLVGHFYKDDYYLSIKNFIIKQDLEKCVFIYGSCADISNILKQSTIGVLSSKSEGLPVALLEYALAELPIIVTNVGDCNLVISNQNEGIIIEPENNKALADAILSYINDLDLRNNVANNLHLKVVSNFSEKSAIESLIKIYSSHLK